VVAGLVGGALLFVIVLEFNVAGSREWLSHRTTPIRSLAVLPLENLSSDPEQEYFADGMTDQLITDLSKIGALRVISRTSVMPYKGARKPLAQVARELNVDAVLEGTVLRAGERVRITAQLIRVSPENHLWAETYDRDLLDVLALQEEVARDIAREIKIELTPAEQTRLSRAHPINPEAQEDYLKGVYLWNKRSEPELEKSIEYLNQAIQKDPNYALAYAALADDYNALAIYAHVAPREICPKARAVALKALELDDTLGEAHAALGFYKSVYEWDQPGADAELRRAIELNPGYAMAHVWRGEGLSIMGRHVEAVAELDRARELDPTSVMASDQRAWVLYMARKYDDAIKQIHSSLELEPGFAHTHCWLGKVYLQKGMLREGLAELEKSVGLQGGESPVFVPWLGYAYALSGRRGDALKVIGRLENQEQKSYASPYGIAAVYCGLGEKTLALAWLEKAYQQRDPMMSMVMIEPAFDPLQSDARFKDLIRRAGSPP
jgi:TolB-like protein/Flp pilus assembly protein TadD